MENQPVAWETITKKQDRYRLCARAEVAEVDERRGSTLAAFQIDVTSRLSKMRPDTLKR